MDSANLGIKIQINSDDPTKAELVFQGIYNAATKSISSYPPYNIKGGLTGDGSITIISTIGV